MEIPAGLPGLGPLDPNDTVPSNIDNSTVTYLGTLLPAPFASFMSDPYTAAKFPDDGQSVSIRPNLISDLYPGGEQGWTTIEAVLIRLNTLYTTSGRFPVHANKSVPSPDFVEIRVDYDAAVCVQKYEPWIVEAYKTSIVSPILLRVVDKGYRDTPPSPSGNIQGPPIAGASISKFTNMPIVLNSARSACFST